MSNDEILSNKDKLYNEGVIPDRPLTKEEEAAIESLTKDEVDSLISINDKLEDKIPEDKIEGDKPLVVAPGRRTAPGRGPTPETKQ
jgi:hypothetical protein